MRLWLAAIAMLVGFHLFAPNAAEARDPQPSASVYPWPAESWPVSTPEEQGMDSASLARLVETVGTFKQDSFLIVRHGRIVADAYYAPFAPGIAHDLRSITKSVVGTLTAIQLHKGMLDSTDQRVVGLFS